MIWEGWRAELPFLMNLDSQELASSLLPVFEERRSYTTATSSSLPPSRLVHRRYQFFEGVPNRSLVEFASPSLSFRV